MKILNTTLLLFWWTSIGFANNLFISNVVFDANANTINFDVAWDNGFKIGNGSHDFVYILIKYKNSNDPNWYPMYFPTSGHLPNQSTELAYVQTTATFASDNNGEKFGLSIRHGVPFNSGSVDSLVNPDRLVSLGGFGIGYCKDELINNEVLISRGGNGDGYDMDEIIVSSGRPNYPLLGAQLLSIGNPTIPTGFRCAELWVQAGASFSGKLNTTLSNQSLLLIDDIFIWKNPNENSFLNHSDGMVEVRSGGVLMTQID